jgi:hypothetical protein
MNELKPTTSSCAIKQKVHARENIPLRFWSDLCCVKKVKVLFSLLFYLLLWLNMYTTRHLGAVMNLRMCCIQLLDVHVLDRDVCRSKARHPGPTQLNHAYHWNGKNGF